MTGYKPRRGPYQPRCIFMEIDRPDPQQHTKHTRLVTGGARLVDREGWLDPVSGMVHMDRWHI